jgi:hypothetical protein
MTSTWTMTISCLRRRLFHGGKDSIRAFHLGNRLRWLIPSPSVPTIFPRRGPPVMRRNETKRTSGLPKHPGPDGRGQRQRHVRWLRNGQPCQAGSSPQNPRSLLQPATTSQPTAGHWRLEINRTSEIRYPGLRSQRMSHTRRADSSALALPVPPALTSGCLGLRVPQVPTSI